MKRLLIAALSLTFAIAAPAQNVFVTNDASHPIPTTGGGGGGGGAVTIADGAAATLGAKADAKSTATDTTAVSAMSVLKQISASVQAPPSQAVTNAGTFAVQATISGNQAVNVAQVAGTTTDTNSGNKSAGTQRVVLATDQPALTNSMPVKQNFRTTWATGQVTLSNVAGTMVAANATRRRCIIKNTDAAITITCGPATVTAGNGMPIKAGESHEFTATPLIQCIAASGSPVAAYSDESD